VVAGKLGPSGSRDRRPTGGCRQALDANYLAAHSWLVFPLMRLMVRTGVQEDGEEAVGEVAIGQRASLDRILVGVAAGPVARGLASDRVRVGSCLMGPDTEATGVAKMRRRPLKQGLNREPHVKGNCRGQHDRTALASKGKGEIRRGAISSGCTNAICSWRLMDLRYKARCCYPIVLTNKGCHMHRVVQTRTVSLSQPSSPSTSELSRA